MNGMRDNDKKMLSLVPFILKGLQETAKKAIGKKHKVFSSILPLSKEWSYWQSKSAGLSTYFR